MNTFQTSGMHSSVLGLRKVENMEMAIISPIFTHLYGVRWKTEWKASRQKYFWAAELRSSAA